MDLDKELEELRAAIAIQPLDLRGRKMYNGKLKDRIVKYARAKIADGGNPNREATSLGVRPSVLTNWMRVPPKVPVMPNVEQKATPKVADPKPVTNILPTITIKYNGATIEVPSVFSAIEILKGLK